MADDHRVYSDEEFSLILRQAAELASRAERPGLSSTGLTLTEMIDAVEKDALQDALKSARGNRAKAARLLSTTERIFNYKVRKDGIDWRRFRA